MNASLTSPPIATEAGQTVVEYWLKGIDPACGTLFNGLRVDQVVVGRQAA